MAGVSRCVCASGESSAEECVRAGSLPASSGILTIMVDPADVFGGTLNVNDTPLGAFAVNV